MKSRNKSDMADEIFLLIFSWLDATDLTRAMQVSKGWHKLAAQDPVWRQFVAGAFREAFSKDEIDSIRHLDSVRVLVRNSFIKGDLGEHKVTRTVRKLKDKKDKLEELRRGPERQASGPSMPPQMFFMVAPPFGGVAAYGGFNSGQDFSDRESFFAKTSRWVSIKFAERKINKYKKQLGTVSEEADLRLTLRSELKRLNR